MKNVDADKALTAKVAVLSIFLFSCASFNNTHYTPVCFPSEEKARALGSKISDSGFFPRVSYWVTGDSNNSLPIGLMWAGFDPTEYCPEGGYPIVALYESDRSDYDPELVLGWSRTVLKTMINEFEAETE
jgi:hypothetical protein